MSARQKSLREELTAYIPELQEADPWGQIVQPQEADTIFMKYIAQWLQILRSKCRQTFPTAYAAMEAQQFRGYAVTRLLELTLTGIAMYGAVMLLGGLFKFSQPPRPYSCGGGVVSGGKTSASRFPGTSNPASYRSYGSYQDLVSYYPTCAYGPNAHYFSAAADAPKAPYHYF